VAGSLSLSDLERAIVQIWKSRHLNVVLHEHAGIMRRRRIQREREGKREESGREEKVLGL
jgi:hypothetical protein